MSFEISIGSATSNVITGTTSAAQAVADIRAGKWADQVAAVRAVTGDERAELKRKDAKHCSSSYRQACYRNKLSRNLTNPEPSQLPVKVNLISAQPETVTPLTEKGARNE